MAVSLQVQQFGRTSRTPRRPQHPFNVIVRPFQICPVAFAPVLPGETMKNLLLQARVVTDPIKNPLTGWWCEFYTFYVKHRDLNEPMRTNLVNIMVDPSQAIASAAANAAYYQRADGTGYMIEATQRVVETYFRDANEAANAFMIGSYYAAQLNTQSFLDSALLDSAYLTGSADDLVVGADDTVTGAELSQSYILWQQYRMNNLTHLTYEEYLATYGIPLPSGGDSARRPELVRFAREWSYPVNTVNPSTGAPSSAVSWAISERADKDRFFREPGWLLTLMCIRPKTFLAKQGGTLSSYMKDGLSWLPAVMGDNPEYSVRKYTASTGPLNSTTTDYRIDLKDLFLYGEQFINFDPAVSLGKNQVDLPSTTLQKKYPSATDADSFFVTPATAGFIKVDGIVSLNILGMQTETSPTQTPGGF